MRMWNEKAIKIIPPVVFLFCLLEIFELGLVINNMDRSEKLEAKIENNLKVLERIMFLLDEHLDISKDKRIKIK